MSTQPEHKQAACSPVIDCNRPTAAASAARPYVPVAAKSKLARGDDQVEYELACADLDWHTPKEQRHGADRARERARAQHAFRMRGTKLHLADHKNKPKRRPVTDRAALYADAMRQRLASGTEVHNNKAEARAHERERVALYRDVFGRAHPVLTGCADALVARYMREGCVPSRDALLEYFSAFPHCFLPNEPKVLYADHITVSRVDLRSAATKLRDLLLRSGNVERNPGPCYGLHAPGAKYIPDTKTYVCTECGYLVEQYKVGGRKKWVHTHIRKEEEADFRAYADFDEEVMTHIDRDTEEKTSDAESSPDKSSAVAIATATATSTAQPETVKGAAPSCPQSSSAPTKTVEGGAKPRLAVKLLKKHAPLAESVGPLTWDNLTKDEVPPIADFKEPEFDDTFIRDLVDSRGDPLAPAPGAPAPPAPPTSEVPPRPAAPDNAAPAETPTLIGEKPNPKQTRRVIQDLGYHCVTCDTQYWSVRVPPAQMQLEHRRATQIDQPVEIGMINALAVKKSYWFGWMAYFVGCLSLSLSLFLPLAAVFRTLGYYSTLHIPFHPCLVGPLMLDCRFHTEREVIISTFRQKVLRYLNYPLAVEGTMRFLDGTVEVCSAMAQVRDFQEPRLPAWAAGGVQTGSGRCTPSDIDRMTLASRHLSASQSPAPTIQSVLISIVRLVALITGACHLATSMVTLLLALIGMMGGPKLVGWRSVCFEILLQVTAWYSSASLFLLKRGWSYISSRLESCPSRNGSSHAFILRPGKRSSRKSRFLMVILALIVASVVVSVVLLSYSPTRNLKRPGGSIVDLTTLKPTAVDSSSLLRTPSTPSQLSSSTCPSQSDPGPLTAFAQLATAITRMTISVSKVASLLRSCVPVSVSSTLTRWRGTLKTLLS